MEILSPGLEAIDVRAIPHGVNLASVMSLIERHIPGRKEVNGLISRGLGMDLGCGWGRAMGKLDDLGIAALGLEINPEAVRLAKQFNEFVDVADVRLYGAGLGYKAITYLENVDVCVMIALLENLPGDWQKAVGTAMMSNLPGGYLVIAGVAAPEYENPVLRARLGSADYARYQREWLRRIAVNHRLGLDRNSFVVVGVGEDKESEWGDEEKLTQIINIGRVERIAQHMDLARLETELGRHGYQMMDCVFDVWGSRLKDDETKPPEARYLSGYMMLARKIGRYLVHPWYAGMTLDQANEYRNCGAKHREQVSYDYGEGEMREFLKRIDGNIMPYNIVLSPELRAILGGDEATLREIWRPEWFSSH